MKKIKLTLTRNKNTEGMDDFEILNKAVDALTSTVCSSYATYIVYEQELTIVIELTRETPMYIIDLTKEALNTKSLSFTFEFQ